MKPNTLDAIYALYMKDVYRYLRSLCYDHHAAEDLTQETFYRAYLHLDTCSDDKVKPWLFRVAFNAFVDFQRKERRSSVQEPDYFRNRGHTETPEEALLRQERWDELFQMISELPDMQRHALQLYDFGRLSYEEAAGAMGVGLAHFKVLLFRARQRLRKSKEGTDDDERGI